MNPTPPHDDSPYDASGLDDFPSESGGARDSIRHSLRRYGPGTGAVVVAALTGIVWWGVALPSSPATPPTGVLRVESDPGGADVRVDGVSRGSTPTTVTLAAGAHRLFIHHGDNSRQVTLTIAPGSTNVDRTTWVLAAPPDAFPPASGDEPAGAPAAAAGLRQPTTPGWLEVASPAALQIYEGTRLLGTTRGSRLSLSPGSHELDFAADPLGFRVRHTVRITSQAVTSLAIDVPRVPLSINATPWADVWIDGMRAGQTPLGNLPEPIGVHEIEFRHPQLGTKRVNVTVSLNSVARVAVDMRAP